ncbi:hypothetical protein BDQ17DRAFT_1546616 [Cyathus striatus]|nr:hypothetical protein BDQ17DRAFT_1546616 [Cyathus striatus]
MLLRLVLFISTFSIKVFALRNLTVFPGALPAEAPLTVYWEGQSGDGDSIVLSFISVIGPVPTDTRHATGIPMGNGTYDISLKSITAPLPRSIIANGNKYTIQAFLPATNTSMQSNIFEVNSGPTGEILISPDKISSEISISVVSPISLSIPIPIFTATSWGWDVPISIVNSSVDFGTSTNILVFPTPTAPVPVTTIDITINSTAGPSIATSTSIIVVSASPSPTSTLNLTSSTSLISAGKRVSGLSVLRHLPILLVLRIVLYCNV